MNKIPFPKFKDYDGQPVRYIQKKADGHLVKIYRGAGGVGALTKNDKDITDKLLAIHHIRAEIFGLPANSQIFAELHCPGRFATDVKTMLNEANEDLRLTAFAAPMLGGVDMSSVQLHKVMGQLIEYNIEIAATVTGPLEEVDAEYQQFLLADAVKQKIEGWVLKESHMSGWYKLKPTKTVDCFVTNTTMSTSASYYGGLKSIDVAVWDWKDWNTKGKIQTQRSLGTVGGGFEAAFRLEYNTQKKRETLVGRVCEVEYDCLTSGGKLRFPRFLRWRTDKDKDQCTSEQL